MINLLDILTITCFVVFLFWYLINEVFPFIS